MAAWPRSWVCDPDPETSGSDTVAAPDGRPAVQPGTSPLDLVSAPQAQGHVIRKLLHFRRWSNVLGATHASDDHLWIQGFPCLLSSMIRQIVSQSQNTCYYSLLITDTHGARCRRKPAAPEPSPCALRDAAVPAHPRGHPPEAAQSCREAAFGSPGGFMAAT